MKREVFSLFILNVDVELVIRDLDSVCIKLSLDCFVKVKVDSPVISGIYPCSECELQRAITMSYETNEGDRIFKHERMSYCRLDEKLLNELDIAIICNREREIDTSDILCAVVCDIAVGKCSVGNGDLFVIGGS